MDSRKLDIGQVYGYAVCLVAILIFLFGAVKLADAYLNIRELDFTQAYIQGPSLVSLEAYKIDLLSQIKTENGNAAVLALAPEDSTWQRMFELERLHRLALGHQTCRTNMVVNAFLSGLAVLLFAFHWRWLRIRERHAFDERAHADDREQDGRTGAVEAVSVERTARSGSLPRLGLDAAGGGVS